MVQLMMPDITFKALYKCKHYTNVYIFVAFALHIVLQYQHLVCTLSSSCNQQSFGRATMSIKSLDTPTYSLWLFFTFCDQK